MLSRIIQKPIIEAIESSLEKAKMETSKQFLKREKRGKKRGVSHRVTPCPPPLKETHQEESRREYFVDTNITQPVTLPGNGLPTLPGASIPNSSGQSVEQISCIMTDVHAVESTKSATHNEMPLSHDTCMPLQSMQARKIDGNMRRSYKVVKTAGGMRRVENFMFMVTSKLEVPNKRFRPIKQESGDNITIDPSLKSTAKYAFDHNEYQNGGTYTVSILMQLLVHIIKNVHSLLL